jgi:hypothetical protein
MQPHFVALLLIVCHSKLSRHEPGASMLQSSRHAVHVAEPPAAALLVSGNLITGSRCAQQNSKIAQRVALCFYGITRNLRRVLASIQRHIFGVLEKANIQYDVFVHSLSLKALTNARSEEKNGTISSGTDYVLLQPCIFQVEDQLMIRKTLFEQYSKLHSAPQDPWKDNFASVKNYQCALHSLARVALLAQAYSQHHNFKYDAVVVLRPDVAYVRDIDAGQLATLRAGTRAIMTPDYMLDQGVNDRFAMGGAKVMLELFMTRGEHWARQQTLQSGERFLKQYFWDNNITQVKSSMRVLRVRADGHIAAYDTEPDLMNASALELARCMTRTQVTVGKRPKLVFMYNENC